MHSPLFETFIFLCAACVVVPIASRFRLGSVLGYLVAGILIGPFGIGVINNSEQVMGFAQFGVIMMLFLIGLELEPSKLWSMRKTIVGLGGLQVLITSVVAMGIGMMLGFSWTVSLTCGMALSLSSTALVLQLLEEKGLMHTHSGEAGFSVLLFQDIAVIPILVIIPLLAASQGTVVVSAESAHGASTFIAGLPAWLHACLTIAIIACVILLGKYFSRHAFRFIAKSHLREVFTALSLALIVGVTLLMQAIGVSPALGAFIAGLVLANSEYKHTLETDIQPFKGLLLGLFFISIGMEMQFSLFAQHPVGLIGLVLVLMIVKGIILAVLGKSFGLSRSQNALFACALAEGGEFAFVLFQYAAGLHLLTTHQSEFLIFAVALSMALTPFVMMFNDKFILPRFMSVLGGREFDTIDSKDSPIVIAGYGRFGQIIGRFARAQGVKVTILDSDPDQIELLRKFGNKVYFGDPSRLEMLQSAGLQHAKIFVVAVDDGDKAVDIVRMAREHFPNMKIFVRARNRKHAYELQKAGCDYFRRETFDSALTMAEVVMRALGHRAFETHRKAKQFEKHDEAMLHASFDFMDRDEEFVDLAKQSTEELGNILKSDLLDEQTHVKRNDGWGG